MLSPEPAAPEPTAHWQLRCSVGSSLRLTLIRLTELQEPAAEGQPEWVKEPLSDAEKLEFERLRFISWSANKSKLDVKKVQRLQSSTGIYFAECCWIGLVYFCVRAD